MGPGMADADTRWRHPLLLIGGLAAAILYSLVIDGPAALARLGASRDPGHDPDAGRSNSRQRGHGIWRDSAGWARFRPQSAERGPHPFDGWRYLCCVCY